MDPSKRPPQSWLDQAKWLLMSSFMFLLFGAFLFPWMIWSDHRVGQMHAWSTLSAEVVETGTAYHYRRFGMSNYTQEIRFRYVVDGREYHGNRVSYGGVAPNWPTDAEAAGQLPELGSYISVRYDPENPQDSVIWVIATDPSKTRNLLWFVGFVAVVSAAMVIVSARAWNRRGRSKTSP